MILLSPEIVDLTLDNLLLNDNIFRIPNTDDDDDMLTTLDYFVLC